LPAAFLLLVPGIQRQMYAAILLDPRLAFLSLCVLLLGAAIPLAFAWARLLPEEPPPFPLDRPHRRGTYRYSPIRQGQLPRRDSFAVVLLVGVSISYLLQIPGLPSDIDFSALPAVFPIDTPHWVKFGLLWLCTSIPGMAAVYSLLRPNFLRIPLIAAGVLVPLLWLLRAPLHAAMTAIS
jgi:hypothetical protein